MLVIKIVQFQKNLNVKKEKIQQTMIANPLLNKKKKRNLKL
jgi:hypothetical protein